jgi:hypothetical protein
LIPAFDQVSGIRRLSPFPLPAAIGGTILMSQSKQPNTQEQIKGIPVSSIRNPYILNFCKVLVEKKGEKHEPDALKKLLDDMYRLYENLLGQNMVNALPDDVRKEYLALCNNLDELSYEKIQGYFDKAIIDYEQIMKDTMKQFAEIFMSNRNFDPKDYPVSSDFNPAGSPNFGQE